MGIKKGSSYLETRYSKTGRVSCRAEEREERVEAYTGIVGAHCVPEARLRGCEPRRVPAQPERAPPALRAPRSFRTGTDHAAYAFFYK